MLVMSRDPADAAQKMQFASSSGTQQFNQLDQLDAFQGSLDEEQKEVLHACLAGANVFFSGMGGTGKTFLLKRIVAALKARHGARAVACCAPTGVRMYNRRGA
jgi:MoxR-like ATPase